MTDWADEQADEIIRMVEGAVLAGISYVARAYVAERLRIAHALGREEQQRREFQRVAATEIQARRVS